MKKLRKRFDYLFSAWFGYLQTISKHININHWEKWLGCEYTFVLKQRYGVEKVDKVAQKARRKQKSLYSNINIQHTRKIPKTGVIWNDNNSRFICFRISENKNRSLYVADLEVLPKSLNLGYKIDSKVTTVAIMRFIEQNHNILSEDLFKEFMSQQTGIKKQPPISLGYID